MIDFTVMICTYNGMTRLPQLLDQLISQSIPDYLSWEILIVDNNSTDQTASIVHQYRSQYHHIVPIHYAFEIQQGIAFARKRGIQSAKGELIGFLDDDNFPAQDWVMNAYHFAQSYPNAGAYGSQIEGKYEVSPPPNFEQIACFLAIINRGEKAFRYDILERWLMPPGAGLVARKKAWLAAVPSRLSCTGVQAKSLANKGEDIEALSYIRQQGWEIWHNPMMKIHHQIPYERLQKPYLIKLTRSVGLSRYPTRMLQYSVWQKPAFILAHFCYDLYQLIAHYFQYNILSSNDLVAQCKLEFLIYSFLSPFYHWKKQLSRVIEQKFNRAIKLFSAQNN